MIEVAARDVKRMMRGRRTLRWCRQDWEVLPFGTVFREILALVSDF